MKIVRITDVIVGLAVDGWHCTERTSRVRPEEGGAGAEETSTNKRHRVADEFDISIVL